MSVRFRLFKGGRWHARVRVPDNRAASALRWAAAGRFTTQGLQFCSTLVLARLLSPADYGLMAIVAVFTGFAFIFTNLGLSAAVVHEASPDQTFLSTAFWTNAVSGLVLTATFCALAPLVAAAFGEPKLLPLLLVASAAFTISVGSVHLGLLERELHFRRLLPIEALALFGGSTTAIIAATRGMGPMSLVLQSLVTTAATTYGYWRSAGWKPSFAFSRDALNRLFAYSRGLLGFSLVNYWLRNADNLLVGKVVGTAALGLYVRAYNLMLLPVQTLNAVLGRVLFPVLSKLRTDPKALSEVFLKLLAAIATLTFPVAIVLALSASGTIHLLYGPSWLEAAPLLTILSFSAPVQVIGGLFGALCKATGRTNVLFRMSLVGGLMSVVAFAIGIRGGVRGVAIGFLVYMYCYFPVVVAVSARMLRISSTAVIRPLTRPAAAGLVMAAVMLGTWVLLDRSAAVVPLLMQCFAGTLGYLASLIAMTSGATLRVRMAALRDTISFTRATAVARAQ